MSIESDELITFIDNEEPLYRQKIYIFKNLAKKKEKKTFKESLAPKAFVGLLNIAAKKFVKDYGGHWNSVFSPIDRRHAACTLVERFHVWYGVDYQHYKKK